MLVLVVLVHVILFGRSLIIVRCVWGVTLFDSVRDLGMVGEGECDVVCVRA